MRGEARILREAPLRGALAQAYLIHAAAESAAEEAARQFVQRIFCQNKTGCGTCAGCQRAQEGNHTDLMTIHEEGSIKIAALREVAGFISQKPYEGGYQCVWIQQAHTMTPEAQNALLKSLEEPQGQVVFVLSTAQPNLLLSTVRSRCLGVRIAPQPRSALLAELGEGMQAACAQAGGFAEEARLLAASGTFEQSRRAAFAVLARLVRYRNPSLFETVRLLTEGDLPQTLWQLALALRDALYIALTGQTDWLQHPDRREELSAAADRLRAANLLQMMQLTLAAYEDKRRCPGLHNKMLAERLMLSMFDVLRGNLPEVKHG